MNNSKTTKRALFTSVMSLVLCCVMLIGTTFAWFTDSASTGVNKIQSGTLAIDLIHGDPETGVSIKDNSDHKIFDYDKWEPGYTQVETLTVVNEGNLALKYEMKANPVPGTEVLGDAGEKLSDVIDVYMCFGEFETEGKNFANDIAGSSSWWKVGTLTEWMKEDTLTSGKLLPAGADTTGITLLGQDGIALEKCTVSVALHMQETAGNEYQNLSLGDVGIVLNATQWTYEEDSFGDQYDANATYALVPTAKVTKLDTLPTVTIYNTTNSVELDAAYSFTAPAAGEADYDALLDEYKDWNADFVVTTSADVKDAVLAGQYDAWSQDWLAFESSAEAGESYRLLKDAASISITYKELCDKVKVFNCGIADSGKDESGVTVTVELRLYETEKAATGSGSASIDAETGKSIVIGTYSFTF